MTPDLPPDEPGLNDDEMGAPIAELRDLSIETQERFGQKVRGGIERRVLAGEVVHLAWTAPITMVLEFFGACLALVEGKKRT